MSMPYKGNLEEPDYYAVLDISRKATASEIKKAYHRMAMKWHPDKVKHHAPEVAHRQFQLLADAFDILGDEEKRKIYDDRGYHGLHEENEAGEKRHSKREAFHVFESFFEGRDPYMDAAAKVMSELKGSHSFSNIPAKDVPPENHCRSENQRPHGASWLCTFCGQMFRDPRKLKCGHSVCLRCAEGLLAIQCLKEEAAEDELHSEFGPQAKFHANKQADLGVIGQSDIKLTQAPGYRLPCPVCNDVTPVPTGRAEDVELDEELDAEVKAHGFEWDTYQCSNDCGGAAASDCGQCKAAFCDPCFDEIHQAKFMKTHTKEQLGYVEEHTPRLCDTHEEELKLFCKFCHSPLCAMCAFFAEPKHRDLILMTDVRKSAEVQLVEGTKELNERAEKMDGVLGEVKSRAAHIGENYEAGKQEVVGLFDDLRKMLDDREKTLLEALKEIHDTKQENLDMQILALTNYSKHARRQAEMFDKQSRFLAAGQIAAMPLLHRTLDALELGPLMAKPVEEARVHMNLHPGSLKEDIEQLGFISTADIPLKMAPPVVKVKDLTTMTISWGKGRDGGTPITAYRLDMAIGNDPRFHEVYLGNALSHDEGGITPGLTYRFVVRAVNRCGDGPHSDPVEVVAQDVPSRPDAPEIHFTSFTSVVVSWREPECHSDLPVDGYAVEMADAGGESAFKQVYLGDGLKHSISPLTTGSLYRIRVRARNMMGMSAPSPEAFAVAKGVPDAPPTPTIRNKSPSCVEVWWTHPHDNGSAVVKYFLEISTNHSAWEEIYSGLDLAQVVSELAPNNMYRFRVLCENEIGRSAASGEALVVAGPTGITVEDLRFNPDRTNEQATPAEDSRRRTPLLSLTSSFDAIR